MRVPRYGTHNGIKYNPRRTLIRFCEHCGEPFQSIGHGKKYCSAKCCASINYESQNNKEYHRNYYQNNKEYFKNYYKNYDKDKSNAAWNKWFNKLSETQQKEITSINHYASHIKNINKWDNYVMHHMLPKSLFPEFAKEEWNLIPISEELHNKFHNITGGKRMAKYPRWWSNELVNFIYDEIHTTE